AVLDGDVAVDAGALAEVADLAPAHRVVVVRDGGLGVAALAVEQAVLDDEPGVVEDVDGLPASRGDPAVADRHVVVSYPHLAADGQVLDDLPVWAGVDAAG